MHKIALASIIILEQVNHANSSIVQQELVKKAPQTDVDQRLDEHAVECHLSVLVVVTTSSTA